MNAQFAPLFELAALPLRTMSACTVGAPLQTYPLRVLGGVIEVALTQPS